MNPLAVRSWAFASLALASLLAAAPAGHDLNALRPYIGGHQAANLATLPSLQIPPPMPKSWPPDDQQHFIPASFLADPLVQDALAYVQAVVPASILNIPVSTYVSGPTVKYLSDPVANCYWPANQCVRTTATANYKPDVFQCPQQSTWGISFDDGPTNDTVNHYDSIAIRAQLDKMKIKATFFIVGTNLIESPNIVLDEYNDGHQIGVHTWTHHPLTSCTNEQIVAEIKYTEALIYKTIGQVPNFFRPPYGDIDDRVRSILGALGYTITIWDKDDFAADQATTSTAIAQGLINNVTSQWLLPNQPGFVSLSHDITPFTSEVVLGYLKYIDANRASIPLTIEPVGTCVNQPWYRSNSTSATSSASSSAAGASATGASGAASTAASTAPAGSLSASGAASTRAMSASTIATALATAAFALIAVLA
ncbi:uncharacterized protein BJ171DRAFT_461443 [Polychytrium aggregatum]|uniref:uncharacterized protein n=1 Tax=Polychytrium aggregatum TaxID=110093 RepID=UPI0022FE630E|nr:uncharacterized protein BJ171DRAFT_461443 [Polychytrium aggregatum]KAI9202286.1 hypothetical protein BJ171DRAFT_461443 [Polychytrium aggregatum]